MDQFLQTKSKLEREVKLNHIKTSNLDLFLKIFHRAHFIEESCLPCESPSKEPMELEVIINVHHRRPHEFLLGTFRS